MAVEPWFLHVDLDAFFASVEQLDHPEYRGKPVIVGGLPTDPRSVVSTASYEARKYGVHSAMPTVKAYKLCPEGIYVRGNMKRYEEMSYQIMQIFKRFSPDVMQMSIDEAFIDLTGTERLFGKPEDTAMEIKRIVKEETGLTVSIGLSRSKYFAKVSSGLNKPDGFYFMKPGTESDFMLRQPIDKIWGIGGKTAKRIFDSGIKTTKQLYEKSLDVLTFMYGESTGTFLYNIIRGNADGMFDGDVKSHSISNERTFPFDVTDVYTNETALLELAHSVMFRLLRDNLSSRTVVIKIRYEDFTTVSIRQTYSSDILTLDSFYEKAKDLFEKKYEVGRGVRLLGVGFDNVKTERSTYQQDLFDDGEKKKQAVEQAILKIEKKFPDIHVQKARTVKSNAKSKLVIALFLLLGFFIKTPVAIAEDVSQTDLETENEIEEAPESLFDFNINDANVEFLASGFWDAKFTGNVIMSFNGGKPFSISLGAPVFKQEVNLSTWIMINKKWYFEADFADEFKKNTFTLGYKGDGLIKSAMLSNRNIIYPSYYSSALFGYNPGGGQNQAPGFSMHLENDKLYADFMVRYDMQELCSATFYGYNSVTDTEIRLNDYITGRFFVIPSGYITKIKDVYVENISGSFRDKNGRQYKKLSSSQYFVLAGKSTLILSEEVQSSKTEGVLPTVIVTFSTDGETDTLLKSIGSYSYEKSFLGKIQKYFNQGEGLSPKINLEKYAYNIETKIENEKGIILQSPEGFSPFVIASNYDFGFQSDAEVYIYSKSNDKPNSEYLIEQTRDTILFSEPDFFNEQHSYGTVFWESAANGNNTDYENNVSLRFPLASSNPMIYLNNSYESDLSILLRIYSVVPALQIDSGVSSGCVQVYKNGILDSGAKYDSTTGIVTLSSSISDTDKIYITWAKETENLLNGKITAGIGAGYYFTPNLKTDLDFTLSLPISPFTKYAAPNSSQNGYAAISSGVYYENEGFAISDAVSFSVESENVTGAIIVLESSSNIPETFYLSSSDGYESKSVPVLSYLDKDELKSENKTTPGNLTGVTDENISGYKIPIEVNFKNISETENVWTSADIKLSNGNLLLSGDTFNFALKHENLTSDYDVYLQLGTYASDEEIKLFEELIPTWKISEKSSSVPNQLRLDDSTSGNWQTVSVKLSDSERARFSTYHDARIIVVSKANKQRTETGVIYAGPYETEPIAFDTVSSSKIQVKSSSSLDASAPSRKKFSKDYNFVNKVEWNSNSQNGENKIKFGSFFTKTDYSNYEKIKFDYKMYYKNTENAENSGKSNTFCFVLENDTKSISDEGTPSVKAVLGGEYIAKNDENWHTFEINIIEKKIYIDGEIVPFEELYINKAVIPSAMKIEIDGCEAGEFYFDTLYFDGTSPYLKAQNYFATSYKKEGAFVSVNETPILSDFEVNLNSRQSTSVSTNKANQNPNGLVQGFIESGVTLSTVRISADTSLSSSNKKIVDNAGHAVTTLTPIFNVVSIKENFRFNTIENSAEKKDSVSINIERFFIPLTISGNANSKDSAISKTQSFGGEILFSSKYVLFDAGTNFNQKINVIKLPEKQIETKNYFASYASSTVSQFSDGDENAASRTNETKSSLTGKIPLAELSPKVSYLINGEYKSIAETTYSGTQTLSFEIPFAIKNNGINLAWKKQGGKLDGILKGGNYKSDLEKTFSDVNDMDYFFSSILFHDLFDDNLRTKLLEKNLELESQSLSYVSNYSILWNRKLFNSIKDFFIPVSAGFEVERNIKATETISDFHQYKISLTNSFINLFGAESNLKLFTWYNQDEFSSSATCAIKVPYEDKSNITCSISLYAQMIFYITNAENLKTAGDIAIETSGDWSAKGTLMYSHLGKKTPLLSLFEFFYKGEKDLNAKITRNEFLNIELNSKGAEFYQKYELGHSCEINFLKNFTLSGVLNTAYTNYKTKADTLVLEATIGGRMEF